MDRSATSALHGRVQRCLFKRPNQAYAAIRDPQEKWRRDSARSTVRTVTRSLSAPLGAVVLLYLFVL
jgi:hypothetical protein